MQLPYFFTGRNFAYDRALTIIEDEEYLEDFDFDDIRKLRRSDINYVDILKKLGTFDVNANVAKNKQNVHNTWTKQEDTQPIHKYDSYALSICSVQKILNGADGQGIGEEKT